MSRRGRVEGFEGVDFGLRDVTAEGVLQFFEPVAFGLSTVNEHVAGADAVRAQLVGEPEVGDRLALERLHPGAVQEALVEFVHEDSAEHTVGFVFDEHAEDIEQQGGDGIGFVGDGGDVMDTAALRASSGHLSPARSAMARSGSQISAARSLSSRARQAEDPTSIVDF